MSNAEDVSYQAMLRQCEKGLFADDDVNIDKLKQAAFDALEALARELTLNFKVEQSSVVSDFIEQLKWMDI